MPRSLILGLTVICLTGADHAHTSPQTGATTVRQAAPQPVRVFPKQKHPTENLLFSPNGQLLAVGSETSVRLWAIRSGQCRHVLPSTGGPLAFSPDSRLLATASGGRRIRLWDLARGRVKRTLSTPARDIQSLAFSPDGHTLALADYSGNQILLYETRTWRRKGRLPGEPRLYPGKNVVGSVGTGMVKFSPNGRYLASAHEESVIIDGMMPSTGWIRLWDTTTWRLNRRLSPEGGARISLGDFAFTPTSQFLIVSVTNDGTNESVMTRWELATGKAQRYGEEMLASCRVLAFAAGGKVLIAGGKRIGVWFLDADVGPPRGIVTGVQFDSPEVEAEFFAGTARVRPTLNEETAEMPLAISRDGQLLATASPSGAVKLWDVAALRRRKGLVEPRG
jgi:WD40 repeat protein